MAKISEMKLTTLSSANIKALKLMLAGSRCSSNAHPLKSKAHQTRRRGRTEGQPRTGAKWERVKRKGSVVSMAHPPAANLSPNEEAAAQVS